MIPAVPPRTSRRHPSAPRGRGARLALALALLVLPAILAPAAAAQEERPLPGSMSIPLPRVGDEGVYTVTLVRVGAGGALEAGPEQVVSRFQWLAPAHSRDASGHVRLVNQLYEERHERPGEEPERAIHSYDAGTGRLVSRTRIDAHRQEGESVSYRATQSFDTRSQGAGLSTLHATCGVANPAIQGKRLDLARPAPLLGDACSLIGSAAIPGALWGAFLAHRRAEAPGHEAVAFASEPHREADVWLAEGLPYPLRVAFPSQEQPGAWHVLRLARFRAGEHSIATTGEVADAAPAAPLVQAPREAWGPDDRDAGFAFSISEAFRLAREDANGTRLRDFLSRGPHVYAERAQYQEVDGPGAWRAWGFTLTDGQDRLDVMVTRRQVLVPNESDVPPPLRGLGLPGDDTGQHEETRLELAFESSPVEPGREPAHPRHVPTRLPTMASLVALWRAYAGEEHAEGPANRIAFQVVPVRCVNAGVVCDSARVQFNVGRHADASGGEARDVRVSELAVDHEGRVEQMDEHRRLRLRPGEAPALAWSGHSAPALAAPAVSVGFEGLPTPIAWGAGAALVALVLYVSRGLVLAPLYSRLTRARVESHPTRARILALVGQEPGLGAAGLARAMGEPESTVRYHVDRLRKAGSLVQRGAGPQPRYYLPKDAERAPVGSLDVLRAIADAPDASGRRLAETLGLDPSTVHHHLARLEQGGFVETRRVGRERRASLTPRGREALPPAPSPASSS